MNEAKQHKWGNGYCSCGQDTYICQSCGRELCAEVYPPVWRPDITGHSSAGNVCPTCLDPRSRLILAFSGEWRNPGNIPMADIPQS